MFSFLFGGLSILEFALICVFYSISLANSIFRLNFSLFFHYLFLFSSLNSIQPGKPLTQDLLVFWIFNLEFGSNFTRLGHGPHWLTPTPFLGLLLHFVFFFSQIIPTLSSPLFLFNVKSLLTLQNLHFFFYSSSQHISHYLLKLWPVVNSPPCSFLVQ